MLLDRALGRFVPRRIYVYEDEESRQQDEYRKERCRTESHNE